MTVVIHIIGNSKEFIISLGSLNATEVRNQVKTYSITSISSSRSYYEISGIDTSAKSSLGAAFSGSFTVKDKNILRDYTATFVDANTIQCAGSNFTSSGKNEKGEYVFTNSDFGMSFYVKIQEATNTIWYAVD